MMVESAKFVPSTKLSDNTGCDHWGNESGIDMGHFNVTAIEATQFMHCAYHDSDGMYAADVTMVNPYQNSANDGCSNKSCKVNSYPFDINTVIHDMQHALL